MTAVFTCCRATQPEYTPQTQKRSCCTPTHSFATLRLPFYVIEVVVTWWWLTCEGCCYGLSLVDNLLKQKMESLTSTLILCGGKMTF